MEPQSLDLLLRCLLLTAGITLCNADIIVHDHRHRAVADVEDRESITGTRFPVTGIEGKLVEVVPDDACKRLSMVLPYNETYIALVRVRPHRHCDDAIKLYHVVMARFAAALLYVENDTDSTNGSQGNDSHRGPGDVPAAEILADDAHRLLDDYPQSEGYTVRVYPNRRPGERKTIIYILVTIIALGCIFLVVWTAVMVKFCYDRIKRRPQKLTIKSLKKIPIKMFQPGDPYDLCAICLEDYEEGDKLRLLPCSHAYHQECVDPWLLTKRCLCPLCKKKVIPTNDTDTDGETEDENEEPTDDDDRTPLLQDESDYSYPRSGRRNEFEDSDSFSADLSCDLMTHQSMVDVHLPFGLNSLPSSAPISTSSAMRELTSPGEYDGIDYLTSDIFPALGRSANESASALVSIPCGITSYSTSPLFPVSDHGSPPIAEGDLLGLAPTHRHTPTLQLHEDYYSADVHDDHSTDSACSGEPDNLMWEPSSVHGQIV